MAAGGSGVGAPLLVCAGPEPATARRLVRRVRELLRTRTAVVLGVWKPAADLPRPVDAVLEALYGVREELDREAREYSETAVAAAAEELRGAGWEVRERVVRDERRFWQVALEVADEVDAAALAASTADRPRSQPGELGSEIRALAHRGRRPLLVVPQDGEASDHGERPALFAYDGSDPSLTAAQVGAELLEPRPAVVATAWQSVLTAAPISLAALPSGVAAGGAEQLDGAARKAAGETASHGATSLMARAWQATPRAVEARAGVWRSLVEAAAAEDAAVVVTGTRGQGRLAAALLGSVAEGLLRHARRPVLLVPPDAGGLSRNP